MMGGRAEKQVFHNRLGIGKNKREAGKNPNVPYSKDRRLY
jgi:hypothetical protein